MNVLLHICCAPCALYPIKALREEGHEVVGFWFNPNVHPYLEYRKRLWEVRRISRELDFELIERDIYSLVPFLRKVLNPPAGHTRCEVCYALRLEQTARTAKARGFGAFTTTLLHSKYQRHDALRGIGEEVSRRFGVRFLYRDFREGWSEGLDLSRKFKLYRQQYCGCVVSEFERFFRVADAVLERFEWVPRPRTE